jgi:hypothetical protein
MPCTKKLVDKTTGCAKFVAMMLKMGSHVFASDVGPSALCAAKRTQIAKQRTYDERITTLLVVLRSMNKLNLFVAILANVVF